jgi:hypothetical protein
VNAKAVAIATRVRQTSHGIEIGNFYRWDNAVTHTRGVGTLAHCKRILRQLWSIQVTVGIKPMHHTRYFLRCTNKLRLKSSE